jgi:rubrerythrin
MSVKLPEFKCPFCGHKWTPRVQKPLKCPLCGHVLAKKEGVKVA